MDNPLRDLLTEIARRSKALTSESPHEEIMAFALVAAHEWLPMLVNDNVDLANTNTELATRLNSLGAISRSHTRRIAAASAQVMHEALVAQTLSPSSLTDLAVDLNRSLLMVGHPATVSYDIGGLRADTQAHLDNLAGIMVEMKDESLWHNETGLYVGRAA